MSNFDGVMGLIVARVMARSNAAAEAEAVEILDPDPSDAVLVVGFGPGVGVEILARRLPTGRVLGIDPSEVMMRTASRRCRKFIDAGRVALHRAEADAVPAPDRSLDGAVAVNALQLCEPIRDTARELARVLRPGARLVSITHGWAAAHHAGDARRWIDRTSDGLQAGGFTDVVHGAAKAEEGRATS